MALNCVTKILVLTENIKLCNKNIGFNGKFFTFPYFCSFMLKSYLKDFDLTQYMEHINR